MKIGFPSSSKIEKWIFRCHWTNEVGRFNPNWWFKMEKNTENIVKRAYAKLTMLRRLKRMGADSKILKLVYYRHIRSILEFGVPVWNGALTINESKQIERVQKIAIHIIYGRSLSYRKSLEKFNIERLKIRRRRLCLNFAKKALKHKRFKG